MSSLWCNTCLGKATECWLAQSSPAVYAKCMNICSECISYGKGEVTHSSLLTYLRPWDSVHPRFQGLEPAVNKDSVLWMLDHTSSITCRYPPSQGWYSFTEPGGMEGWVGVDSQVGRPSVSRGNWYSVSCKATSSQKRSVMARVVEESHSSTCHPRIHPWMEWTIPALAFPAEAGSHLLTPK